MNAFNIALTRAAAGLDWSRPCLVWVADYLLSETSRDPAHEWRDLAWTEAVARRELVKLASEGEGKSAVSRALDTIARRNGWEEADSNRQGAVMVGVFDDAAVDGVPALFDGRNRWLVARMGAGCLIVPHMPDRIWEVKRA